MDKSGNADPIKIESESKPGEYHLVDINALTCTCIYFARKLRSLPLNDPHRLCKHLIKALIISGIPEFLEEHKEAIETCAVHNSAFVEKGKEFKKKTWDKYFPLPEGSVVTLKTDKKKKYVYLEGVGDEKKILATIPINGGMVGYSINNFRENYDLLTQKSDIPWNYRYMEQAIITWIVDEYNKLKTDQSPLAEKKVVRYKLNPDAIPEGNIKTVSCKKVDTASGLLYFMNLLDVPEDNCEYFQITAVLDDYQIDAVISPQSELIRYSINQKSPYYCFLKEEKQVLEKTIDLHTKGIPISLEISIDFKMNFPKHYQHMEGAFRKWLRDEYLKLLILQRRFRF